MSNAMLSLKFSNAQLKKDVRALTSVVGKLQTKNGKLKADIVALRCMVKALEKQKILPEPKVTDLNDLARRLTLILDRGGYEFVDGKMVQARPARVEPKGEIKAEKKSLEERLIELQQDFPGLKITAEVRAEDKIQAGAQVGEGDNHKKLA